MIGFSKIYQLKGLESKKQRPHKLLWMFRFDVKVYLMTSQPLADFLLMPLYNMLFAYWINICFGNQQKHFLPIIRVFPDGFQDSITFQTKLSKLVVCCWADGFFLRKSRIRKFSLLMSPKYTSLPFLTSLSNRLQLIFPPFSSFCLTTKCRLASNNIAKIYLEYCGNTI